MMQNAGVDDSTRTPAERVAQKSNNNNVNKNID
jgi:hypothetical protein